MDALSIVLNESNNQLIKDTKHKIRVETIIDNVIDEFIEFIDNWNFYNDNQHEIEIQRKMLKVKYNEQLDKYIQKHEMLEEKFKNVKLHCRGDIDEMDDTTGLIQSTNAIYLLKYKKEITDNLMKTIDQQRTTKCCGKVLNCNDKTHKHYSFYEMIDDRIKDMKLNSCGTCKPVWRRDTLYNCEICHLKWKLFYKCFFQYVNRTTDVSAEFYHKNNCRCFYSEYTNEEIYSELSVSTRSNSHWKSICDLQNDIDDDEMFSYYDGLNDKSDSENDEFIIHDDEYHEAYERKLIDVIS